MVASTVMALAITTAITTMQQAFLALDSARNITLAGQILQGELEKLRLVSWEDLGRIQSAAITRPETIEVDALVRRQPSIGERFTLTRTIDTVSANLKEITVTIAWKGYDRRPHSRYYKACYAREGLYDYFSN